MSHKVSLMHLSLSESKLKEESQAGGIGPSREASGRKAIITLKGCEFLAEDFADIFLLSWFHLSDWICEFLFCFFVFFDIYVKRKQISLKN